MKKRILSKRLIAAVAAVAALCAVVLAISGCSCSNNQAAADEIEVPDVTTMTSAEATKAIEGAGLKVGKVTKQSSDKVAADVVISQEPKAKTKVGKGSEVSLVVSSGKEKPDQVEVPDLTGMTQDAAEKALDGVGLTWDIGDPVTSDTIDAGLVCQQSVKAGTKVDKGTKVVFNLSQGKDTVTVPDFSGMVYDDAKAQLLNMKLGVDQATEYDSNVPMGCVIDQSVPAGTDVALGTVITLNVSLGPEPPEHATVPDVAGMSGTDAAAAMQQAGLVLDYDTSNPSKVLSGSSPDAGSLVDPGSTVEAVYPPDPTPTPVIGGWTFNGDAQAAVDAEAQAVFNKGVTDGRTAIAVLATRGTAGNDYAFLCMSSSNWSIVGLRQDDGGNVSVLSDTAIDPANVKTVGNPPSTDWVVADAPSTTLKPADAQTAFTGAMSGYAGVSVTPIATIATQVVSGTEYLIFGIGAPVTPNPDNSVYVVDVTAGADGSNTLGNVSILDLTAYLS